MTTDADIRRIYEQWHDRARARDVEGTLSLYADDAVLESPLVMAILDDNPTGILRGKTEIRPFFRAFFRTGTGKRPNDLVRWYRTGVFFSNGRQLTWEYPRQTPDGDQVDLIEMMDIEDGLIQHHRIYWGWFGVSLLLGAALEKARAA